MEPFNKDLVEAEPQDGPVFRRTGLQEK